MPVLPGADRILDNARRPRWRYRRSIWIHGATRASFEDVEPLLARIRDRVPAAGYVFTSASHETLDWLRARYLDDAAERSPGDSARATDRFFARYHPKLLLWLGGGAEAPILARANERIPAIALAVRSAALEPVPNVGLLPRVVAPNLAEATRLSSRGIPPGRITLADPGTARGVEAVLKALEPYWPTPGPGRMVDLTWIEPSWRDRIGQSRVWRRLCRPLQRGRVDTWRELGARLNHPTTIWCVGNGPSSEDPFLGDEDCECLFRANHRWRERGFLSDPAVVFIGAAEAMIRTPDRIYGFWDEEHESGMLLRHAVTRGPRPIHYFTMTRISEVVRTLDPGARPSSGALMVAAAAGLRPARIVIAGIDLFADPRGRYADDPVPINAYSAYHDRDVDVDLMATALAGFEGLLEVVGKPLQEALSRRGIPFTPR